MTARTCGMTTFDPYDYLSREVPCRQPEYHDGDHVADVADGTLVWPWTGGDPEFVPHARPRK